MTSYLGILFFGVPIALVFLCVWCVRECFAEGGLDVEKPEQRKPWRRTRILGNVLLGIFCGVVIFSLPAMLMSMMFDRKSDADAGAKIGFLIAGFFGWIIFLGGLVRLGRRVISRWRAHAEETRS